MKEQDSMKTNKNQIIRGLSISNSVIGFLTVIFLLLLAANSMSIVSDPIIPNDYLRYIIYGTSALTILSFGLTIATGILVILAKEGIKSYSNSNLGMSLIVIGAIILLFCIVFILMSYLTNLFAHDFAWVAAYSQLAMGVLASALISTFVVAALCKKQAKK